MSILINGERVRIKGNRYFDPAQEPKSGYAVPQEKYCKVEQEKHRKDFLEKWVYFRGENT